MINGCVKVEGNKEQGIRYKPQAIDLYDLVPFILFPGYCFLYPSRFISGFQQAMYKTRVAKPGHPVQ